MKTITFTDFRKKASGFITQVEHGEAFVIVRHGKPVAEIIPFSDKPIKSLSANNACLSVGYNGGGHMQQRHVCIGTLFITDQDLSGSIEP